MQKRLIQCGRGPARWALAALLLALCGQALAFYPFGGWDQFDTVRYAKWKIADFDTNNDGRITTGEGREVQIEGGPSGFNAAEIETIKKCFNAWQQVPTTYASFRIRGIFQDPILQGSTLDGFDTISSIYLQVTAAEDTGEDVIPDPDGVILSDLTFPVLGITLILYNIDDTVVEVAGQAFQISAGTIIDSDIVINAALVRPVFEGAPTTAPVDDLQGVMTHELGHFLGLGHPALSNLRTDTLGGLIESPVLPYTAGDGIQRLIGVTPTMFPFSFQVTDNAGNRVAGARDLAPDDISGVSFLYPRGSQAAYFNVNQEARSQTRPESGIPSFPLPGAHIVAWADADGNPDTPRVPVFATMAGLYTNTKDPNLEGRFQLQNLWKQFEIQGASNLYRTPSYTFTMTALNGGSLDVENSFTRQSPVGITPLQIDSMHQASFSDDTRADDSYVTSFASEVFNETENIIDVSNHDAGTSMVWNYEQNDFLSEATGKNLASMLPQNRPMFGDPTDVCPLFITEIPTGGGTGTGTGTTGTLGEDRLRGFRDNILMRSALGTGIVSAYYRVAPSISWFLGRHPWAFTAFRGAKLGVYWTMDHALPLLGAMALVGAAAMLRRRRSWALAAATAALWVLVAGVASAQIAYQTFPDFVGGATDIVSGKVTATSARWGVHGRIFTDVTIEIASSAKGKAAKANSTLTFTVLGGQIDKLVMKASELPTFAVGDEGVFYLNDHGGTKYGVYGGIRGKVGVFSSSSGAKFVNAEPEVAKAVAEKKAKAKGAKAVAPQDGKVDLDDYLDYVRDLVAQQEAANTAK